MGRFWKMCVPNFRDAGTVTEIPTCLKSGITENLSCLRSEIKLYSSVATQDSHPGSSMQCTVLLAIARWGEGATETVGETRILFYLPSSPRDQTSNTGVWRLETWCACRLHFEEYLKDEDFSNPSVKRKQELHSSILFILMIQSTSSQTLRFSMIPDLRQVRVSMMPDFRQVRFSVILDFRQAGISITVPASWKLGTPFLMCATGSHKRSGSSDRNCESGNNDKRVTSTALDTE